MSKVSVELKEVCDTIYYEISLATLKWHIYKQLFAMDENRLKLLEHTANAFFIVCQDSFISDVFISLSRLTENPKSGKGARVSIRRLLFYLDQNDPHSFYKGYDSLVSKAEQCCLDIHKHRNETVGHLSLSAILNMPIDPLPELTINQIDNAIKCIQDSFVAFSENVLNESNLFYPFIVKGDADALVHHLQISWDKYEEEIGKQN